MKRSAILEMPQFFERYINKVDDVEINDALVNHRNCPIEPDILEALAERRYAEGKWIVKDILQHVIDTERIMTYRALRFARRDETRLPGYEEKLYGAEAKAEKRTISDLLEEWNVLRQSSILMFRNFDDEMLMRGGSSNDIYITVLALGFVIVGHPIHHWGVIKEKYYPLLG